MIDKLCVSFDDVLIEPTYTDIESRSDVDTSVVIAGVTLEVPLISSPMDTVTEAPTAITLGELGGMGILHRFGTDEERIFMIEQVSSAGVPCVFAVGASEYEFNFLTKVDDRVGLKNVDAICIDIANGYSIVMKKMLVKVKTRYPYLKVIAGNVATGEGYEFLADHGADAVRVGIGGGSICMTRIQTGIGIPTLHSVLDCHIRSYTMRDKPQIIADGGIKYPQDLCKSMVGGSHAVICGGIFAGTKESPGDEIMTNDGFKYKRYRGMASEEVQVEKRGGLKEGTVAEGVSTLIPYKGSLRKVVGEFKGGLVSSMTYINARTTDRYIGRPDRLRRVTENGVKESHAYGTRKR